MVLKDDELSNAKFEFGEFKNGVFHDNAEMSAYAEVKDGFEPELFYGSNYTNMRDEPKKVMEEDIVKSNQEEKLDKNENENQ